MEPWHHAAGRRLSQPHRGFRRGLRYVSPHRGAVAVGARHIGDGAPVPYGLGHAPLLVATPNDGVPGPALMVGIKPSRNLAEFLEILYSAYASSQVSDVDRIGRLLFCHGVPLPPDFHHAVHIHVVVFSVKRAGGVGLLRGNAADLFTIDLPAALAIANVERTRAGPAVGEESVHGIAPVNLTINGGHLLGEIGAEHAGVKKPWRFIVLAWRAIPVSLEPFRVGSERFLISQVAVHARHHAETAFFRRRDHLSKHVA